MGNLTENPRDHSENDHFAKKLDKYIDLFDNEKIIETLTRNLKSFYIPRLFRAVIFWIIVGTLWIIVQTSMTPAGFGQNIIENLLLGAIIIWGIVFGISMLICKPYVRGHRYVLTTSRIILYREFLGINFREIEYKRITDLVLFQSLWGRIWNFGTLLPVTAGVEMGIGKMGKFSIEGVENVFRIRNLLLTQIRKIQKQMLADFQLKAIEKKNKEEN